MPHAFLRRAASALALAALAVAPALSLAQAYPCLLYTSRCV